MSRFFKFILPLLILFLPLVFNFSKQNIVLADTGVPSGTLTSVYNPSTKNLTTTGGYAWSVCSSSNTKKYIGIALFADGGTPQNISSNALHGSGMEIANNEAPCKISLGTWSSTLSVERAPNKVCVVVYDVEKNSSGQFVASGNHSTIGAGTNRNEDNSWDKNNGAFTTISCAIPTQILTPTPTPVPACIKNNPTLVVSPGTLTATPGEEKTFTITLTNNDSKECQPSTFNLTALVPSDPSWNLRFEKTQLTLTPGETGSTKLFVTSPLNHLDGPNTITVIVQEVNGIQLTANVHYVVKNPVPTQINTPTPSSTITLTPTITPNFTPSPTPLPGKKSLNFRIGIDGIGTTPRIPIGGNKNPDNIDRQLTFKVYSASTNTLNYTVTSFPFTYNPNSEKFEALYEFPDVANVSDGLYNIYVDGPRFLRTAYPGSVSIKAGQTTNLTSNNFYLITGNINNTDLSENKIDLMDYNVLLSCSIYSQDLTACGEDPNYQDYSDLNDDGKVDLDDFTLWLKELANQDGAILPE